MTRCHKSGGINGALGSVLHSSVLGLPVVPGAAPRSAVSTCVAPEPVSPASTLSALTAEILNSGIRLTGCRASFVSRFTAKSPPQWNGTNIVRGWMSAVTLAATSSDPRSVVKRARPFCEGAQQPGVRQRRAGWLKHPGPAEHPALEVRHRLFHFEEGRAGQQPIRVGGRLRLEQVDDDMYCSVCSTPFTCCSNPRAVRTIPRFAPANPRAT